MLSSIGNSNLDYISRDDVKIRLRELNNDTPAVYTTSFIKSPQEITLRTIARNNIMLDKVLENQEVIIKNQNEILKNMGNKLDINV